MRAARITAWVRLSTPSFVSMAETCAFTVASETESSNAICLLSNPCDSINDHSFINSCLVGSYQRPGHFYYLDCSLELCSFQLHHAKFRRIKLCSHQRAIVIFSCIKLRSIKPFIRRLAILHPQELL